MKEGPDISHMAALIGDPGRANILTALMGGHALTASELAGEAGVALPTASGHLAKLVDGGLLRVRKQGRHKYFALANENVATVLEGLMGLASQHGSTRLRTGPKESSMRRARVCYSHLAGEMGVQMYESMLRRAILIEDKSDVLLTDDGASFVAGIGVDLAHLDNKQRPLCLACLDWSERKTHLAGSLGRALLARFEELGWAKRDKASRAVIFSDAGQKAFRKTFF